MLRHHFPGVCLVEDVRFLAALPKVSCTRLVLTGNTSSLLFALLSAARHLVPAALVAAAQGTELVVAGFPCTDVSRAGKRAGLEGKVGAVSAARLRAAVPQVTLFTQLCRLARSLPVIER